MADIELRFHKDMLVLSAPLAFALANQGVDMETEAEYMSLVEPETMRDALRLESMAGAQCLVAETDICEARLAHKRMEDRARELAQAAISHARANAPQHVLCEVGPCGLPLDATSAMSMKQCAAQYEGAARALVEGGKEAMGSLAESEGAGFDAIFLNGLRSAADVQCGIEGVRRAYTGPVFVSVDVNEKGEFDGKPLAEAIEVLAKADVIGIRSAAASEAIAEVVREIAAATPKPILVQVSVRQATAAEKRRASLGAPIPENPYALPDFMADAAVALRAAGAQFLRACGEATPAYTGALAAGVFGADSIR